MTCTLLPTPTRKSHLLKNSTMMQHQRCKGNSPRALPLAPGEGSDLYKPKVYTI